MPVSIDDIETAVRHTKSETSARGYLAMLRRLREFLGDDTLSEAAITAPWVAAFGRHLLDAGLTPASVRQFQKFLRASLRAVLPQEKQRIKEAFADVGSANETHTRLLTAGDLRTLLDANTSSWTDLQRKTRLIFLISLFSGGSLSHPRLPAGLHPEQALRLRAHFADTYGKTPEEYLAGGGHTVYAKILSNLGISLRLPHELTPRGALDGWAVIAREAGCDSHTIAATAPDSAMALQTAVTEPETDPVTLSETLQSVADKLWDIRKRWHVMRATGSTPEEILAAHKGLDTYRIPQLPGAGRHGLLAQLIFFRCTAAEARDLKRNLWQQAYVYSYRGSGQPAAISDVEMQTFMLIADIAGDTMAAYFPEEGQKIEAGTRAEVTKGPLKGIVGIVEKNKEESKVLLTFHSLGGAQVSATLPTSLLRPRPTQSHS